MKAFSPLIALLNRLKYPQKFTLITLLFILPLAAFYPLVAQQNQRIQNYSAKEYYGTLYLRPLQQLLRDAQQYQLTADGSLSLNISTDKTQAQIDSDFQELEQINGQYGTLLQANTALAELESEWRDLKTNASTMPPSTRDERQKKFIKDIRALMSRIGDTSFLILDPDLDTYYMMDTVLLKLPESQDLLIQTLTLGEDILQHHAMTADQRTQLIILTGLLTSNLTATENNVYTAYKNNPSGAMQKLSAAPLQAYVAAVNQFLNVTNTDLLNAPTLDLNRTDFAASANQALNTNSIFYAAASQALEAGVQSRRQHQTRQVISAVALAAGGIIVAFIIGLFLMLSISRPLSSLAEAAQRLAIGEMSARVPVTSTADEIGQVGLAFNNMAQELQSIHLALEQRAAEREAFIRELEAGNAELERFTYTVSHDLRNPLVTIKGFLGMLDRDLKDNRQDKIESDFKRIAGATDKMDALLTDLLELSRIGRVINPPAEVDPVRLIQDALESVDARIRSKNVDIKVAPDLPCIYGDHTRLREVFENLIDNAVKYMGSQDLPLIEIGMRDGAEGGFFVRDNGLGIEPIYHSKIFGLFDKLNPTSEGTGIGLALVKRIIETHGGRIWVESEGLNRGSTFYFTIPSSAQTPQSPPPAPKN